jgi:hypothetical protein
MSTKSTISLSIDPDNIQGSLAYDKGYSNEYVEMSSVRIGRLHKDRNNVGVWDAVAVERFAMFCAACAGKNSHQQSAKLDRFSEDLFDVVHEWVVDYKAELIDINIEDIGMVSMFGLMRSIAGYDYISEAIKRSKLGKWNLLAPGFKAMAMDDTFPGKMGDRLDKVAKYSGYGLKTASLFNMHVFHEPCACLDTYILRWLAGDTMFHDAPIDILPPSYKGVPRQSISNWDVYSRWEDAFLSECVRRGMSPLELDKQIWIHARIKTEKPNKTQELCLT